uniref:SDR family oxidoreductase n=1 Tax=Cupriavidus yeoncheonensis TaxID=1462994 RepID=UPI003F491257
MTHSRQQAYRPLTGKIAIVTGGTQGLGADIARELANSGVDKVFVIGIGKDACESIGASIGLCAEAIEADITKDAEIDRCIRRALEHAGRIDILVNCAAIYADSGLASTREQWLSTLNVNLVSSAIFTQKTAPHMRHGSVVINIGSIGGKFGAAGRAVYPASKAALLQLTKSFAVTLAPDGIRVLSVSPSWTWSPMVARMSGGSHELADQVGALVHPLGRVGRGEEIGRAVAFAASEDASWITGTDLAVDGGFSCLGPDQGQSAGRWFERALQERAKEPSV